ELMRESRSAAALAERRVEQLAGVERRLRATVESAGVGLGTADLQGRFLQVTDRLAAILGCGREELLQTTLADLTTGEDRASVVEALALLENGDLTRWEGEIRPRCGRSTRGTRPTPRSKDSSTPAAPSWSPRARAWWAECGDPASRRRRRT